MRTRSRSRTHWRRVSAITRACRASAPARWPSSCKRALGLPPEAISYEWAGDTQPVASNATAEGRAQNRRVEVEVWYDEPKESTARGGGARRRRISSASRSAASRPSARCATWKATRGARASGTSSPPLHYERRDRRASPTTSREQVRQALAQPAATSRTCGQVHRLHRRRAADRPQRAHLRQPRWRCRRRGRTASRSPCRRRWSCRAAAIDSDGRGASLPLASNDTAQGRALNRRVEVEFWYDDPLQELPDEPQLCPGEAGRQS